MQLSTKSKRSGIKGSIDVFYEKTEGFSKHLNDKTTYKMVLINSGSFVVEDNGKFYVITAPAAMAINEKADFKVVSQTDVKSRTIYYRPTVIREEFTLDALNEGKYDKFQSAISDDAMTTEEKIGHLIRDDIKFDKEFSEHMAYQDAILLLEFSWRDRDIVYYSLTKQEFDTVRRLFCSVEYEINAQPDNFWILRTRFFIISILFMATADFYRNYRQADIYENPIVANVTKYLWDHIDEEITLDSVLREFSLNKNALNEAFNAEVSMSCMTYLEHLRMNLAMKELQFGSYTISEISRGVGYADTNYFSKVFKKHTGLTPSEYQKQMRDLC